LRENQFAIKKSGAVFWLTWVYMICLCYVLIYHVWSLFKMWNRCLLN